MAKDAGTAQLGISGGSHIPELEEAAITDGKKMISNIMAYVAELIRLLATLKMFIVRPSDMENMNATGHRP